MSIRGRLIRAYRALTTGSEPAVVWSSPLLAEPVAATPAIGVSSGLSPGDLQALLHAANRYFYLGQDLALVRLNSGHLLFVDPLDTHVSASVIAHGYWEPWEKTILSLLRPGSRVVEVGANIGYYSVLMADAVGPTGSVISLEANPRIAALAKRSLEFNGFAARASVIAKAALDQPGSIDFVTSRSNSGGGYVSVWDSQPYADGEVRKVEAVRLDDLDTGPVDMIRMDAEGSEAFILRGAEQMLRANPRILICMEWAPVQIASRTSIDDFVAWMDGLGFRFWRMGENRDLQAVPTSQLATMGHCDLVASRDTPVTA